MGAVRSLWTHGVTCRTGRARHRGSVDLLGRRLKQARENGQSRAKTTTAEQAALFSRVGEYVRNIHDDLEIARAGGLKVPIVQGQQEAGYVAEYLARAFGAAWFTHGWFKVKFVG